MVIWNVYRSLIPNKTTFTTHCLSQWISKLQGSFEIHWVRQYLAKCMCLVGIVNTTVYKTANFQRSIAWQIVLIFKTDTTSIVTKNRFYTTKYKSIKKCTLTGNHFSFLYREWLYHIFYQIISSCKKDGPFMPIIWIDAHMNIMVFQITGNMTVHGTACSG